jgi:hypothetical protein
MLAPEFQVNSIHDPSPVAKRLNSVQGPAFDEIKAEDMKLQILKEKYEQDMVTMHEEMEKLS